jgi:hypothetical protein
MSLIPPTRTVEDAISSCLSIKETTGSVDILNVDGTPGEREVGIIAIECEVSDAELVRRIMEVEPKFARFVRERLIENIHIACENKDIVKASEVESVINEAYESVIDNI